MTVAITGPAGSADATADEPEPQRPAAPPQRRKQPPLERFCSLVVFLAVMMGLCSMALATVSTWEPVVEYSPSSAVVDVDGRTLLVTAELQWSGPETDRRTTARLVATDLESGERAWTRTPDVASAALTVLAAHDGLVYAGSAAGPVVVDASSGAQLAIAGMPPVAATGVVGTAVDDAADQLVVLAANDTVWTVPLGTVAAERLTTPEAPQWRNELGSRLPETAMPAPETLSADATGRLVERPGCPTPPDPARPCEHTPTLVGGDDGLEFRLAEDAGGLPPTLTVIADGVERTSTLPGQVISTFDTADGPGLLLDCGKALLVDADDGTIRVVSLA